MTRGGLKVALLTLLVFLPSLAGDFILDDKHLIVDNPYVQDVSGAARALSTHLWDVPTVDQVPELLRYYRPTVTLSYLFDYLLSGGRALVFHATNVLLHALSVGLAFAVGRRWLKSSVAAAVAALLFGLHPSRTESVVWIAGRPDLLATVFLLSWLQLTHLARDPKWRPWAWPLSLLFLVLAFLSKETAVAAPVLLVIEAAAAAPSERPAIWRSCALSSGLVACYLAVRSIWLPIGGPAFRLTPEHALVTVLHYAERVLVPWPQTFYFDLPVGSAGRAEFSAIECTLGALIAFGYGSACVYFARRRALVGACLASVVVCLGPLLNLTETGSMVTTSDRFLYLPLWLLALGTIEAVRVHASQLLRKPWLRWAGASLLVLCASVDVVRCLDFLSPTVFWSAEIAANPANPIARRNRAALRADAGDSAGALADLEVALSPRARRYVTVARPESQISALLLQLRIQADQLPDGAAPELDALGLELLRILSAEPKAKRTKVRSIHLGYELDTETIEWLAHRGTMQVALAAAPILSRLDRHQTTVQVLDLIDDRELTRAARPLDVVLAEAREGRFEQARRRLDFVESSPVMADRLPSPSERNLLRTRLREAEIAFSSASVMAGGAASGSASAGTAPPSIEARVQTAEGFAHLGAYLRGLVALAPLPRTAALPLRIQLLVLARLEDAALALAQSSLGEQQAREVVQSLRAGLPESLRALSATAGDP